MILHTIRKKLHTLILVFEKRYNESSFLKIWVRMMMMEKYLELISGKHSVDSVQKTAVLQISYIIKKVLQCET
jgi:hypothetical protein